MDVSNIYYSADNFTFPNLFTLKSACAWCPAKFSKAHNREQYSPIMALASGVFISW